MTNGKNTTEQEETKEGDEPELEDDLPKEVEQKIGDELKNKKFENLGIWVEANMYFKNFKRIKI